MTTWVILDVSCLVYRSYYAMGDLSHEGAKTGGVYGLFRDIRTLEEIYPGCRFVFCFDVGKPIRKERYHKYKAGREAQEIDEEKQKALDEIRNQLTLLRTKYLPYIGYRNVFHQDGYEADDVIASVCQTLTSDAWCDKQEYRDDVVVVSSDQDMYQLLNLPQVTIWDPRKRKPFTKKAFHSEYDISPAQWARVKAMGGCSSDNIPGVERVGEKTAIKFIQGRLNITSKAYEKIVASRKLINKFLKLTKLPYAGTNEFLIKDDVVTRKRWTKAMKKLGMDSLHGRVTGVRKR